ncbi:hypothetical protein GQ42DRAFT_54908 [Ramicandelaber brevisporus]|nr:hypothetical protein GQ42DRAFT_54908 [Ramicandelaber brevisporus]
MTDTDGCRSLGIRRVTQEHMHFVDVFLCSISAEVVVVVVLLTHVPQKTKWGNKLSAVSCRLVRMLAIFCFFVVFHKL